ncbi:MAG TPA: molybdopterin-dependent oxidoreductase [Kutzneria sp.]|nr:molybdopterin-dependent oxidoreductase [Kutzneria sp.]
MSTTWHKTACSLCYVNCGIEVLTDGRSITRVRGDKDNPRTQGYLCQKAQRLTWYGNHNDRLDTPLRRRPDGTHEPISWDQALTEIATKLTAIKNQDAAANRPGSMAYVGGGGQGNHSGGGYGLALRKWMNSTRFFGALSQEKTGDFWVNGKMFGGQTNHTAEGVEDCDLLLVIGCNPWLANGFNRARSAVNDIKNDPARKMIVVDPRRTETAEVADVHLPLRPGTDAYLLAAILALIIQRNGQDHDFLTRHTEGYDQVAATLADIPVEAWIAHTEVPRADVDKAVDLILQADAMTVRVELGIQQGRNSTLNSYLEKLLYLITGNFGRPGTNALHTWLMPLWSESRGERSEITGFEYIGGMLPLNTLAEEILADHPNRARILWVESSNPANTAADTASIERAIRAAELSVVIDVAYTETAALADYVLPAASQHEKWEFTFFDFEFPTNYFHLRPPLFDPLPGTLVEAEIYARLFDKLGLLPEQSTLDELTAANRNDFLKAAAPLLQENPAIAPILLYRTLGRTLPDGAATAAVLWPGCLTLTKRMPVAVQRALQSTNEGPVLAAELFDRILTSPSGTPFTQHEYDEVWQLMRHDRVNLAVPELLSWLESLDPASDRPDPDFPLSLINGQRRRHNANQILRPPSWRRTDPDGALHVRTDDLKAIDADEGDWVAVVSRTGRIVVKAEIDDSLRKGQLALPHGFGMAVPDGHGGRVLNGPRINILTDATDRDPIAGTPHHKDMPVRLEPATAEEAEAAQRDAEIVRALISAGS